MESLRKYSLFKKLNGVGKMPGELTESVFGVIILQSLTAKTIIVR